MYGGARILGLIIARGGSKGLPGKNLRPLAGRPMIAWTIEAAHGAELLDRCVLSSEDPAIIEAARDHGCEVPFQRPDALAADDTTAAAVVADALSRLPGYDHVALLQATSPTRLGVDIDGAIRACIDAGARSCVSVCRAAKSPHWMYELDPQQRLEPVLRDQTLARRQELPSVYVLNGAVYVVQTQALLEHERFVFDDTVAFVMPPERSVDVDSELDLRLADLLLRQPSS